MLFPAIFLTPVFPGNKKACGCIKNVYTESILIPEFYNVSEELYFDLD